MLEILVASDSKPKIKIRVSSSLGYNYNPLRQNTKNLAIKAYETTNNNEHFKFTIDLRQ